MLTYTGVTAIIPRIVSTAEENQHPQHHVVFQLPAQAFGYDMDKVTIDTVKSTESLPQVMREDSNVINAILKGLLQCIAFNFDSI